MPVSGYALRMTDPKAASAAARELSRARWGSTRVDTLLAELTERRDQLQPAHIKTLQRIAAPAGRDSDR
jgi:hypothetical protein